MSTYQTLNFITREQIAFIEFNRPKNKNTINNRVIEEIHDALLRCVSCKISVVVLQGNQEYFCFGADLEGIVNLHEQENENEQNPELMYEVWRILNEGPFVTIAHVEGKAYAGGVGFVAACNLVVAGNNADFGLTELLLGLIPACVMPFLIKKVGFHQANKLTLSTKSFGVEQAVKIGLVDYYGDSSAALLRTLLIRLKTIDVKSIQRYKSYMNNLNTFIGDSRDLAIKTNKEVFTNKDILEKIKIFIED